MKTVLLKKKDAEQLGFEATPNYGHFLSWRMNCRSEDARGSGKPSDAMVCTTEVDEVKSIENLKTLKWIAGHSSRDFEYLDAKVASGLKNIINGDFKRRVFTEEDMAQKREAISHWSADC